MAVHVVLLITLLMLCFMQVLITLRASEQLVRDGCGSQSQPPVFPHRPGLPDHTVGVLFHLLPGLTLLVAGTLLFQRSILLAMGIKAVAAWKTYR